MYSSQLLPDSYLDYLVKQKHPVFIYLRNGGRLTGVIANHSKDVLFLREGVTNMISRRLINMIVRQFSNV